MLSSTGPVKTLAIRHVVATVAVDERSPGLCDAQVGLRSRDAQPLPPFEPVDDLLLGARRSAASSPPDHSCPGGRQPLDEVLIIAQAHLGILGIGRWWGK